MDENNNYEIIEIIKPDKIMYIDISSILIKFGFLKNQRIISTIKTKQFNILNDIFKYLNDNQIILLKYKNEQWYITNYFINEELKYRQINLISSSNNFNEIINLDINNDKLQLEKILEEKFQHQIQQATFIQTYYDDIENSRSCFIFN